MTNEDAIYTLDRLRHIEAKWPGTEDTLKAIEMAIRAIRAVSSNEPLTLDQLRCMDGKPAYWPEAGIWGVISVESNEKWGKIPFFCGKRNGENLKHDIELRGMEVYAYHPAHINREAWVSVEYKMPEEGRLVLVWCRSRMYKNHVTVSTFCDGKWSRRVRDVTYWMHLPDGPVELEKRLRG